MSELIAPPSLSGVVPPWPHFQAKSTFPGCVSGQLFVVICAGEGHLVAKPRKEMGAELIDKVRPFFRKKLSTPKCRKLPNSAANADFARKSPPPSWNCLSCTGVLTLRPKKHCDRHPDSTAARGICSRNPCSWPKLRRVFFQILPVYTLYATHTVHTMYCVNTRRTIMTKY